MKSSFKKIDKGTIGQQAYFGHPEFDAIFENSLSKGHFMVMEEDHPSTNYLSLLRYFLSHNYHENIVTIIFDCNPAKWKKLISPQLKKETKTGEKTEQKSKYEIAWRYDNMNIKLNNLPLCNKISFLDLSKQVSNPNQSLIKALPYPNGELKDFYLQIEQALLDAQEDVKDTSPKKLLLSSLPSYLYNSPSFSVFLQSLRCLTRSSHLFTLLTVPSILPQKAKTQLLKYSDYYVQIGKVGKGYEDFTGSLSILKEFSTCQLRTNFRGSSVWGIKTSKKELRIESLYEQPFEEQKKEQGNDF